MTECFRIKCDNCKFALECVDYGWDGCNKYTPMPKQPQTNEEYLKSCTTEQLAEFLADTINEIIDGITYEMEEGVVDQNDFYQTKHCWVEWLKEKHI